MSTMITVEGFKKSYGNTQAVRGLDFHVQAGKLFAFLGPNGAGKSTTIDMLCTLLKPDGGTAVIDGHTIGREDDAIRHSIGVVFQDSVLDELLTVRENLTTRAGFYGLSGESRRAAVQKAALAVDITEFIDRPYGKLSGGQRRRADIARALVNAPRVLFLDEPTTGLDPKTKEGVWRTIFELQKTTGMTVFLTTHYMEEAEIADDIVILAHGKIAAHGTPYALREQFSTDRLRLKPKEWDAATRVLTDAGLVFSNKGGALTADLRDSLDAIPLLQALSPFLKSFEVIHGSMEDVFLTIIGGTQNV